jgi:hypothetical protein
LIVKVGILGSGDVGQWLARGFAERGDTVAVGSRTPERVEAWAKEERLSISADLPEAAANRAELLVLCTNWAGVDSTARRMRGAADGKTLIDVTNPLSFGGAGGAPVLALGYPDSGGATVQRLLPKTKVVKCFNTVNARFMVKPAFDGGPGDMFLCGNDEAAKKDVGLLCEEWNWVPQDLGGIESAYLLEALAMTWITYGFRKNHWEHAFALLNRAPE